MKRTFFALLSALAVACGGGDVDHHRRATDTVAQIAPDTMLRPPAAALRGAAPITTTDTSITLWSDSTLAPDGSISVARGRVTTVTVATSTRTIDSTWVIPAPVKPIGLPFGIWQTPLDSICKTGYSSALVPVRDSATTARALDRVKGCGVRLVLQLPGNHSRDANGLSVKTAIAALKKWPWDKVCGDSTVQAIMEGDDLTHAQWGGYSTATRIAMWDSIWGFTLQKCPSAVTAARFRPTQIESFPDPKNLKALAAQYTGPRRHGQPATFFASEVASAKRQRLGLLMGLNILNGGCGPASTGQCISIDGKPVPGTSATGADGLYQMSAAELKAYGSVIVADPYACAFLSWAYGYGSDFFTKAANRAALDSLQIKARKRAPVTCKQP